MYIIIQEHFDNLLAYIEDFNDGKRLPMNDIVMEEIKTLYADSINLKYEWELYTEKVAADMALKDKEINSLKADLGMMKEALNSTKHSSSRRQSTTLFDPSSLQFGDKKSNQVEYSDSREEHPLLRHWRTTMISAMVTGFPRTTNN